MSEWNVNKSASRLDTYAQKVEQYHHLQFISSFAGVQIKYTRYISSTYFYILQQNICFAYLNCEGKDFYAHPPHVWGCHLIRIHNTEPLFVNILRSPEIDSQPVGPVRQAYLSDRPARLRGLAEAIPRNQFLGSINVYKYGLRILYRYCSREISIQFIRYANP
jgi:hypothetical protein